MGFLDPVEERIRIANEFFQRKKTWFDKFQDFCDKLKQNPIAFGKLLISYASIILIYISYTPFIFDGHEDPNDKPLLIDIHNQLKNQSEKLWEIGAYRDSLQAKILQADALEGLDKIEESIHILKEIKNVAEQLYLIDIMNIAERALQGETIFRLVKNCENISETNEEIAISQSDEEISSMAKYLLQSLNLPDDRLSNIETELKWEREIAKEKKYFCKYFECIQDFRHTLSKETLHKVDPLRWLKCELYGYKSAILSSTNRKTSVNEFKNKFCDRCMS